MKRKAAIIPNTTTAAMMTNAPEDAPSSSDIKLYCSSAWINCSSAFSVSSFYLYSLLASLPEMVDGDPA